MTNVTSLPPCRRAIAVLTVVAIAFSVVVDPSTAKTVTPEFGGSRRHDNGDVSLGVSPVRVVDISSGAVFVGSSSSVPPRMQERDLSSGGSVRVDTFKGIRYASVRERFDESTMATYVRGKEYKATSFGAICTQPWQPDPFEPVGDEDCLFLNIYRPSRPNDTLTTNSNSLSPKSHQPLLPVAVWIHGGGFVVGSSSYAFYNASRLAIAGASNGTLVVSINYRLGPLGFLCLDAACTGGMNGVGDQVRARVPDERACGLARTRDAGGGGSITSTWRERKQACTVKD